MKRIEYRNYYIEPFPVITKNNRFSISVRIINHEMTNSQIFHDKESSSYILEIEAEKACINLAKNIINNGIIGF